MDSPVGGKIGYPVLQVPPVNVDNGTLVVDTERRRISIEPGTGHMNLDYVLGATSFSIDQLIAHHGKPARLTVDDQNTFSSLELLE